jgi:polyferredoxin
MFRPRVIVYTAVLLIICAAVLTSLSLRHSFRVDIVRDRSTLAREVENGAIENVYRLQIMNATESTQRYRIEPAGLAGLVLSDPSAASVEVGPAEARWVALAVRLPFEQAHAVKPGAQPIQWVIRRDAGTSPEELIEKSTFVVPR